LTLPARSPASRLHAASFSPEDAAPCAPSAESRHHHRSAAPTFIPDDTFQCITRPTSDGAKTTTGAKYRGTKTPEQTIAEVTIGSTPVTVPLVITTFHQVVIDWTIAGWKVDPREDLIGYRKTTRP
jgi:hypothetical protein